MDGRRAGLLAAYGLWQLKLAANPDLLNSWQASNLIWPGNIVAVFAGGGGMLGLFHANFEIAALSNLIFYFAIAYALLGQAKTPGDPGFGMPGASCTIWTSGGGAERTGASRSKTLPRASKQCVPMSQRPQFVGIPEIFSFKWPIAQSLITSAARLRVSFIGSFQDSGASQIHCNPKI